MGVKIVYGKAGTGKSTYCFNEIKKNINIESNIYIIVPEQFSYSAEKKLLKMLENETTIGAEVITFKRMAERVATEVGGADQITISKSRKSNDYIFNTSRAEIQLKIFRQFQ